MKFDLSPIVQALDGQIMHRNSINPAFSSEVPLTLAFMIAHVLSIAVEDLNAMDQAAHQYAGSPQPGDADKATALRAQTMEKKRQRGEFAMKLANIEDPSQVELTTLEAAMILEIVAPRLMPIMLAQLQKVIN